MLSMVILRIGSPVKWFATVAFIAEESSEDLVGASRLAKAMRSEFGFSDRTVTYVGGISNDFGLSDIDDLVDQCSQSGQAGPSRIPVVFADVDLAPLEELNTQEKFLQQSKNYPSQAAKTLLKELFELNPPTVLDPGHSTNSLSADEKKQFVSAVVLKVSLASHVLLEELL